MAGEADRLLLRLDGFEGPLDLLLELARAEKVDLGRIDVLSLAEQFLLAVEGARPVRLELAADWLVMAAWLTWLKSRLLLPPDAPDAAEGLQAAADLSARLRELEAVREGAAWLERQPQLGRSVWTRGTPETLVAVDRSGLRADLPGLLRAYLQAVRRGSAGRPYAPARRGLPTVAEAMERLRRMLGTAAGWAALEGFLPPVRSPDPLARRAAVAATLLAGLELARDGAALLRQDAAFGPILVRDANGG